MTDLERFFQHLVETLATTDPARLRQAIPLAEISGSIVPYRSHRRALRLDSSEDYEAVLMRLAAGEGGYAYVSPDEARRQLERELASPNPDLGVLRQLADAVVSFVPDRVAEALAAPRRDPDVDAGSETEPPTVLLDALLPTSEPMPEPEPAPEPELPAPEFAVEPPLVEPPLAPAANAMPANLAAAMHCLACGEALPDDRRVKFCPYCGEGLAPSQCAACGTALDPAWRFCASCGHPTAGRPVSRRRA